MTDSHRKSIVRRATEPYRQAGKFAWHFARGKLGRDPAFAAILEQGLIPEGARILDIGCGQGLLAAWLLAARQAWENGEFPSAWPEPPASFSLDGIDLMQSDLNRARTALGDRFQWRQGDMCDLDFGHADVVVVLDVLHYVDGAAQEAVLQRIHRALSGHGSLILRVGDAGAGFRACTTEWIDRIVFMMRGHGWLVQHRRTSQQWLELLEKTGFSVRALPIDQGAAFANVMLVATPVVASRPLASG